MSLSASDREMYGIPSYLARDWLALLYVFNVAYFRRMWIVQEVVVSRTVDVMCGHDGCTWDELIAAISACVDLQLGRPYDMGMTVPIMATARARKFYSCGLRWGLLELLVRHRGFESTDQRDKVFAMLGLVEDDQLARLGVKLNYEKGCTVADAYVDLARRVLEVSGRLDLLSVSAPVPLAQGARGVELDLPSWVPDWSRPAATDSLVEFAFPDLAEMLVKIPEAVERLTEPSGAGDVGEAERSSAWRSQLPVVFAAAASSPCRILFDEPGGRGEGLRLAVDGYVVDVVERVGMAAVDARSVVTHGQLMASKSLWELLSTIPRMVRVGVAENALVWMDWEDVAQLATREQYVTGEAMRDVYWRTFLAGHVKQDREEWTRERDSWEALVAGYRGPVRLGLQRSGTVYALTLGAALFFGMARQLTRWAAGEAPLRSVVPANPDGPSGRKMVGRRMFSTQNGYIGLGPPTMQSGDSIVLCKGSSVPYVLRCRTAAAVLGAQARRRLTAPGLPGAQGPWIMCSPHTQGASICI